MFAVIVRWAPKLALLAFVFGVVLAVLPWPWRSIGISLLFLGAALTLVHYEHGRRNIRRARRGH